MTNGSIPGAALSSDRGLAGRICQLFRWADRNVLGALCEPFDSGLDETDLLPKDLN